MMRVYSLFDRKMKEYGSLVSAKNDDSIRRGVQETFRNSNTLVERYPEDFDLYCLGEFNNETGLMTPVEFPEFIENVALILTPVVVVQDAAR